MVDYLLDSDVLIWCLRGRSETVSFVSQIARESLPACSSLSVLEVELGMRKGEESSTYSLIDSLRVIPVDKKIARQAAKYLRIYQRKGKRIDFVDAAIASTCLSERLTLVTYNLKDYPMPEILKCVPTA